MTQFKDINGVEIKKLFLWINITDGQKNLNQDRQQLI